MAIDERILSKGKICVGGEIHGFGDRAASAAALPFGVGVCAGATPATQVKQYAGGTFLGISVYDPRSGMVSDGSGNLVIHRHYEIGDPVFVLTKGRIVVEVEEQVAVEDPVYCSHSTGNFYKQAGAGQTLVSGARFKTAAAGDGYMAELEINLP